MGCYTTTLRSLHYVLTELYGAVPCEAPTHLETFKSKRKHTTGIESSESDKLDFANDKRGQDFAKTIEE